LKKEVKPETKKKTVKKVEKPTKKVEAKKIEEKVAEEKQPLPVKKDAEKQNVTKSFAQRIRETFTGSKERARSRSGL